MTMEEKLGGSNGEDGGRDRFPIGMRVLAVDDDPICLKVLENLLRKCQYHVTTTNQAITALKMLRENRNRYDLVISDVNMPDMDGFKLLELVGLEMDLPVIMLSAHSDTKLVMKGITHGACDYLLKPVRIEELKNIWQHVVRKKKPDSKDQINASNQDKSRGGTGETGPTSSSSDQKVSKKRKDQSEDEDEEGDDNGHEDPSTQKKSRVVWSVELHRKFVSAVNQLGLEKAVPKKILDLMNVDGLTRENVATNMVAALGSKDPSYLRMGSLDGFGDFRTLTGPGRISSAQLSSFPSNALSASETFSHEQLPSNNLQESISWTSSHLSGSPLDLSSSMANPANLEDSRGNISQVGLNNNVIQNIDYTTKQQWGDSRHDYNGNMNNSFSRGDSLVPASGPMMDQSNVISDKMNDVSLFSQFSGDSTYVVPHLDGEKSAFDTKSRSNDDFLFETKPQNGFNQNSFEPLENIMMSMIKSDQNNETPLMDGEFGFDAYSLGSCI
ncbi:hypothetical protein GOBAR_DD27374 [Gossypium barbadense]|nr:hypothetical protein GOBAR_DD27374 [Gossypium barbadense]